MLFSFGKFKKSKGDQIVNSATYMFVSALISLLIIVSSTRAAMADDTEIFFNDVVTTTTPNILFIMDTSGSMTERDDADATRLDRMKAALSTMVNNAEKVNIGLMRFSRPGGTVLYPVTDITIPVSAEEQGVVSARIEEVGDDAEELSTGDVALNNLTLSMANISAAGSIVIATSISDDKDDQEEEFGGDLSPQWDSSDLELFDDNKEQVIGLRFRNVAIPIGATIQSAKVEMIVDEAGSGVPQANIRGELIDSGEFRETTSKDISNRATTVADVPWKIEENPVVGAILSTPDISSIVQEIVDSGSWGAGNAVTLVLQKALAGSGKRVLEGYNHNDFPPLGAVLKLSYSAMAGARTVGLRFQGVDIPQGATIKNASITFTAATASDSFSSFRFKAEDVGDSEAFAATNNNISDRPVTTSSYSWDGVSAWTVEGETHETPIPNPNPEDGLASVVQEIVDRGDWCGGNAMSFIVTAKFAGAQRFAKSRDDNASDAPQLQVEFDPDSIPDGGGCVTKFYSSRVDDNSDDAEENISNGVVDKNSSDLELEFDNGYSRHQLVGMRFGQLNIPQGSEISQAYIEFVADGDSTGNSGLTIRGEKVDNANAFAVVVNNISDRPLTSASASWDTSNWFDGVTYRTADISNVIEEIVGRDGWTASSNLALIISGTSGTHRAYSFNGSEGQAPRLVVRAESSTGFEPKRTKDVLLDVIDDMSNGRGTPIVDAFYEGALYFNGDNVDYGKVRGDSDLADRYKQNNRVSHANSYTGGSHTYPAGCSESNLSSSDCVSEEITGAARYISPISDDSSDGECTASENRIVLLSDGFASVNDSASKVRDLIGGGIICADGGSEECGPELAKFLAENRGITTDTIGFALDGGSNEGARDYLKDIATKGGGSFSEASSQEELTSIFTDILVDATKKSKTFVTAGVAVNSFNRLNHQDELYFSLFKPAVEPLWRGNLKRYKLNVEEDADGSIKTEIIGENDVPAVNEDTGFFDDAVRSWWSSDADGSDVTLGGAANQLDEDNSKRKVYTYLGVLTPPGDPKPLTAKITASNALITKSLLDITDEDDAYRIKLINWIRGVDVSDSDGDKDLTDGRQEMMDPLHSSPHIVTYSGTADSSKNTIFYGDNQGYLHAIDGDNGEERFAFMPASMLEKQKILYNNEPADDHPYGLDGSVTSWVNDIDGNGIIDGKDHVYIYIGMRRGGNNYYALDVTSPDSPKWLWGIEGGTGKFSELGQSWSQPVHTKIRIDTKEMNVLIFAGGYDESQDDATKRSVDAVGRAIYMVNARTGEKVWSGEMTAGDKHFSDMKYSIPSKMTVLDMNGDGYADKMFVGDVGGQLWRFDIHNGSAVGKLVTGGVIFNASGTDADANEVHNRRFYHEPDISLHRKNNENYLAIKIGSGFQAHPLNIVVKDRFYMIKDKDVKVAPSSYVALDESDLFDATDNTLGEGSVGSIKTAEEALDAAGGWYLKLSRPGEKVLASSLTVRNQTYFTTYEPDLLGCSGDVSDESKKVSRVFQIASESAKPVVNHDGKGEELLTASDREFLLDSTSIAPTPVRLRVDGEEVILVGTEIVPPGDDNSALYTKIYWYEQ
ncbi:hypothetical protein A9Q81_02165 [Gammaproteobacteria bacterium 42_54_T18]|mgnify:CR=1 FL=1|nr:hypothetical protein A9Q81_02165 [Gammaproteobacteria bacterium 42_54_T18]